MDMQFDTASFRARYRAGIKPSYNAWMHGGFVLVFGALCIGFLLSRITDPSPWEWLAVPVGLIFYNWGEYKIHKNLGHVKHRLSKLFYQRHTGDHHSFFAFGQMNYETPKDWRVILFPAWLIVVFATINLSVFWVFSQWNENVAALFCATLLLGYLAYEVMHACEHLPEQHPLTRLPWLRRMRRLHELHHARELMHNFNFNIVFPLWDWLYGTLYWEPEGEGKGEGDRNLRMSKMQHQIEMKRSPEQLLAYLATPTRWHEWHPYPVTIKGSGSTLSGGTRFEYSSDRAGYLLWDVIEYVPGRRWKARARGRYGLLMQVTYECCQRGTGSRFTRTLEYRFDHLLGRLANRLFLNKRLEQDSAALLEHLAKIEAEAKAGFR